MYSDELYIRYLYMMQAGTLALDGSEQRLIENEVVRNLGGRGVSEAFIRRAIGEEFRVRIAQEAVLGSQPGSFLTRALRNANQGFTPKITHSDLPDTVRAPMTPAQLWDYYKTKRAEFAVTLLPLHVEDFVAQVKERADATLRRRSLL